MRSPETEAASVFPDAVLRLDMDIAKLRLICRCLSARLDALEHRPTVPTPALSDDFHTQQPPGTRRSDYAVTFDAALPGTDLSIRDTRYASPERAFVEALALPLPMNKTDYSP